VTLSAHATKQGPPQPAALDAPRAPHRHVRVIHIWDTVVSIEVRRPPAGVDITAALDDIAELLAHVDRTFSTFRPDSLVSALRRGERSEEEILWNPDGTAERDLADVLRLCRTARILSAGSFDPWAVPGGFDPAGLVKGWAAGRAIRLLGEHGIAHAMVNAGGDIATAGGTAPGIPWRIGIRDPLDPASILTVVELLDGAVATSGTYERGHHLHPNGPTHATQLLAATIVGTDPALTDALATAVALADRATAADITATTGYSILGVQTTHDPTHPRHPSANRTIDVWTTGPFPGRPLGQPCQDRTVAGGVPGPVHLAAQYRRLVA
jgi:thiamine biosynthesis lipoprotein